MTRDVDGGGIVVVGGGPPRLAPDSVAELQAAVREAHDGGEPLRVLGRAAWADAGRPVRASRAVDVSGLAGVVEYVPGDLTLTARAGTTLAELQRTVAAERQWLPLEPWGGDAGTLGATLATASAGPASGATGLPRDVVLGITVVTGTGEVVRGGGRVVKNVAGFDLVRLMVGAWGTLGVLTEATVRLRALPEAEETLALAAPAPEALDAWLARLRALPVAPLAIELVNEALARRLTLPAGATLLVRLAGNASSVAAQRLALSSLGDTAAAPRDAWSRLRTIEPAGAAVLRLSGPPARLSSPWREASRVAAALDGGEHGPLVHASVARGVARVIVPPHRSDDALAAALGARAPDGVARVFERLPVALWPRLAPSAAADRLSRRVRAAFDPPHLLNPGILGNEPAT